MTITIIHKREGMTAAEVRSTLSSASMTRESVQFFLGGNVIDIQERKDLARTLTQRAEKEGYVIAPGTNDYLEQWEKNYAVTTLYKKDAFKVAAKDTSGRFGPPKEWDMLLISFDATVSEEEIEKTRAIAIEVLSDPMATAKTDDNGMVVPFPGLYGKRAVIASLTHENTGHQHLHFLVNRFAFDMQRKEVSTGIDMSNSSVVSTVMNTIEKRMREAGINHVFQTVSSTGKAVTNNSQQIEAQSNAVDALSKAGGQAPNMTTAQVGVTVPNGQGQTVVVAAPLSPDAIGMQLQSVAMKNELDRTLREIERLKASATALAEGASKLDQAVQVLANEEVLRARLEDAQAKLEEATIAGDHLKAVNESLTTVLDETQALHQELHESLVDIGSNLVGKEMLRIDGEQAEALQSGDRAAIGAVVDSLGEQVAVWNEALDQLPDDMANALRDDPFKGLNDLVDELLESRKQTAELTAERDGLRGDLANANTRNSELQTKVTSMESDLEDIKAKMARREEEFERRMAEQVQLVRNAQSDVARAEGKVSAKEEQLNEEKAKVEKLTRTKDTLLNVMTSENPGQSWESSKDYIKDDTFANRAMGAFLRTASELEQAQQRIATMQNELDDLGQVRENLVAAQATIEEQLGRVNDGGVADLRALNEQNKKLQAANETLQAQVRDLAEAAELAQEEARKAQEQAAAAGQGGTAQEVEPELQSAVEVLRSKPELASLLQEARSNDALLKVLLEFANEQNGGMQPAQGATDQGTDYTKGLTRDNDGPKQDDPDQSNKQ